MQCPYCLFHFHDDAGKWLNIDIGYAHDTSWQAHSINCARCEKLIVMLQEEGRYPFMVLPKAISRSPLGEEVIEPYRSDYLEACAVSPDSAKASAALSRRTLQLLLRDVAKVKHADLSKEIQEVLDSGKLPSHLAEAIDAVRNIGNFAAHPIKSTNTGEIVDVEPGEAEWLLDVLEGLFDFYFTQPAILQKKKDALNKKLADAGKPPMK
jgi:hypothetical protein